MDTRAVIRRFQAERQVLARMEHEDIARVLDAGATPDGRPFVVMELVRGEPIAAYCLSRDLPVRDRVRLMVRACRAIHHAHQRAVIHRDVKPSNILVAETDGAPRPRIIDFGIAKVVSESRAEDHTRAGDLLGTPRYMSPEQLRPGGDVDTRADVYALGVVLCEVLTGQVPRDPETMATRPADEPPAERPSRLALRAGEHDPAHHHRALRGDLDRIVLKAVAWDPERRYESAAAMAADLERYLRGEPVLATPPSTAYRLRKLVGRHRVATGLGAAAAISLVAGTGVALAGMQRAIDQRHQADRQTARAEFVTDFFLRDMLDAADPDIARGEDVNVRSLLGVARVRAPERFADDPEILIDVLTRVGHALAKLSDAEAAAETLAEAAAHSEALHGPDDPRTLDLLIDLEAIDVYNPRGHSRFVERRRELRDRAVAALGPDHPVSLRARFYGAIGSGSEAYVEELTEVEAQMRRRGLADTEEYIRVLRAISVGHADAGHAEASLEYKRRALDLAERLYCTGHSVWIEVKKAMAGDLIDLDRLDEAAAALEEVRAYETDTYGSAHVTHVTTLNKLIQLQLARARPDLAVEHARESEAITRELFGADSIPHTTSMQIIGRCLVEAGRPDEAREVLERILDLRRQQWGERNHNVGVTHSDLARACLDAGDSQAAAEHAAIALDIIPETNDRWLTTRVTLARAHAARGDASGARAMLEDAFARALTTGDERLIEHVREALSGLGAN